MHFQKTVAVLAFALCSQLASVAEAGWVIVDESGNQTSLSRGRLKMSPKESQGMSMSLDIGRARMWVADAGKRAYWEGSVEDYCEAMKTTMAGASGDTGENKEQDEEELR